MTYETLSSFAQTWGLIYFVAMFAAVVGYVLWPRNKKQFDEAAKIPFKENDE